MYGIIEILFKIQKKILDLAEFNKRIKIKITLKNKIEQKPIALFKNNRKKSVLIISLRI